MVLLVCKDSNSHMLGLGIYICRNSANCPNRETRFESFDYPFMCFRLATLHSMTFLFILYPSPSTHECTLLDVISDQIGQDLFSSFILQQIFLLLLIKYCSSVNVHQTEWLGSNVSDCRR
jgi:hypothetical protein